MACQPQKKLADFSVWNFPKIVLNIVLMNKNPGLPVHIKNIPAFIRVLSIPNGATCSKSQVIWHDFWNFKTSTKEVQSPSESQNNSQPDKNLFQPNCFFREKPTNQPVKPFPTETLSFGAGPGESPIRLFGLIFFILPSAGWIDGWMGSHPKNYATTIPRMRISGQPASAARMSFFTHFYRESRNPQLNRHLPPLLGRTPVTQHRALIRKGQ